EAQVAAPRPSAKRNGSIPLILLLPAKSGFFASAGASTGGPAQRIYRCGAPAPRRRPFDRDPVGSERHHGTGERAAKPHGRDRGRRERLGERFELAEPHRALVAHPRERAAQQSPPPLPARPAEPLRR